MENEISIQELRDLSKYFFDYLEHNLRLEKVSVQEDYYWSVLYPAKYNVDEKPEKLGIGQLSEDIYFLKKILENKDLAVAPNLSHFCAILEYLCYNAHFNKV